VGRLVDVANRIDWRKLGVYMHVRAEIPPLLSPADFYDNL